MKLSQADIERIKREQERTNREQIRLHGAEVKESGQPLVPPTPITDWRSSLTRRGGRYVGDERNIAQALRFAPELAGLLRFNEFATRIEMTRPAPWHSEGTEWTDNDDVHLKVWLQERDIDCRSTNSIAEIVALIAKERRWHPLRNRLLSLKWDGGTRICGWLRDYLNATDDQRYLAAVGTAWMIGAVARIMKPGEQVDHVLVLAGQQGAGKTQTARILALEPEYFLGNLPDLRNKDAALVLPGRWIVELAELSAVRRAEVEATKSFITQREDTYRPPYGRRTVSIPRQCVFIGTTNETLFLRDRTGNRRWWPVSVGKVDLELLRKDVEQLWAEAVHLYKLGEQWHLTGDALKLAENAQAERVDLTELDVAVTNYLSQLLADADGTRDVYVTTRDIYKFALNIDPDSSSFVEQSQRLGTKVHVAITANGWEYVNRKGKRRDRTYVFKGRPG
jgi:putative DNA primase/helicase